MAKRLLVEVLVALGVMILCLPTYTSYLSSTIFTFLITFVVGLLMKTHSVSVGLLRGLVWAGLVFAAHAILTNGLDALARAHNPAFRVMLIAVAAGPLVAGSLRSLRRNART